MEETGLFAAFTASCHYHVVCPDGFSAMHPIMFRLIPSYYWKPILTLVEITVPSDQLISNMLGGTIFKIIGRVKVLYL